MSIKITKTIKWIGSWNNQINENNRDDQNKQNIPKT